MLRPRVTLTLLVLVLAAGCGPSTPPTPPFDLLITNARIVDGSGGPSKRQRRHPRRDDRRASAT